MFTEPILQYARQRNLTPDDAAQTLLQILVLRHFSAREGRLIGGTALVLGHGNPRFSEDVDLTQVAHPNLLKNGLIKSAREIEEWFGHPVQLTAPRTGKRTWRLTCCLGRSASLRLHVDSQPYPALTSRPIVIQFPSLSSFICEAVHPDEIMADKVVALAFRNYLGGRDLFDLWFHWLRHDSREETVRTIKAYLLQKLKQRAQAVDRFSTLLRNRLGSEPRLARAREEWRRYLPRDFQRSSVEKEVVEASRRLPEVLG